MAFVATWAHCWLTVNAAARHRPPRLVLPQTHLQDPEGALVAHADEAAQRQLQHHGTFEGDEIADVLQEEEARAVIIAVTARVGRVGGGGDTKIYEGGTQISGMHPPKRPPSLYLRKETTREFLNLE